MKRQEILNKLNQAQNLLNEIHSLLQEDTTATLAAEPETNPQIKTPPQEVQEDIDIDTVEGLITSLLRLALKKPSDEEVEPELDRITHHTIDQKALANLIRFNWRRLKSQVTDYLSDPSIPSSYAITREQDRSATSFFEKKVFLSAKSRNPAPLTLRKDTQEDKWRIYTFSL